MKIRNASFDYYDFLNKLSKELKIQFNTIFNEPDNLIAISQKLKNNQTNFLIEKQSLLYNLYMIEKNPV
jgi:hypothetical protein